MTNEDFIGVDFDYETSMHYPAHDIDNELTRSLISYLRGKGVKTYKVTCPVVQYEGEQYEMTSRRLEGNGGFEASFEEVFEYILTKNARVVLMYCFIHNISCTPEYEEETFKPIGPPMFRETRLVRMGIISNE